MNSVISSIFNKRLLIMALLSVLLAAYGPMTVSNAQSAIDSQKLTQLKEKATSELDRRISKLQETLKSLNVDVHLDKEALDAAITSDNGSASVSADKNGANASATGKNGSTASLSADQNGVNGNIEISDTFKEKVKTLVQQFIDKLKAMKEKVSDSTQLTDMQSLAKSIDSQFGLDQLSNVQGVVTKAIESLTSVFDKLKSTANDLQSQVTLLKECANGVKDGSESVDASVSNDSASVSCGDLNINSKDIASSAQSQLDNIGTIMTTISSVLTSAISLVTTLVASFSGITGSLGNLSSLGDVSNLSSLGNLSGLLSSFSAITSQLDIANGMSGNAQGLLGNVSTITSAFNF